MGCFCHETLKPRPTEPADDPLPPDQDEDSRRVMATSEWLEKRWLPAPPWEPDPDWLDVPLPDPPMPPQALGVLCGILGTWAECRDALGMDPAEPAEARELERLVKTLNRRTGQLRDMAEDPLPWERVATLNEQVDRVRKAVEDGILHQKPPPTPLDSDPVPWRMLITKVKALAPVVAVFQMMEGDPADPEVPQEIAQKIRALQAVRLPPLDDPPAVLAMIATYAAVARLKRDLGADPRPHGIERVRQVVERKAAAVAALLPDAFDLDPEGVLRDPPPRNPNPGMLVNAPTMELLRRLRPETLDEMRWKVPPRETLPMLVTAAPVAALVKAMRGAGEDPVRTTPCGGTCDGRSALQDGTPTDPAAQPA